MEELVELIRRAVLEVDKQGFVTPVGGYRCVPVTVSAKGHGFDL